MKYYLFYNEISCSLTKFIEQNLLFFHVAYLTIIRLLFAAELILI